MPEQRQINPKRPTPGPPDFRTTGQSSGNDLSDLLRQVRRIELRTRAAVTALAAGRYRSAFRGQGMEFDEVRAYTPGDDVRLIDWNVTARSGSPHVKVFREERELTIHLLVDASGSMRFGAIPGLGTRTKLALAAEAAAVIAVNAMRNDDRVGLTLFADGPLAHLAPRKGRGHALRLVREVLAAPAQRRGTGLADALDALEHTARRRGVVFLISDLLDGDPRIAGAMARAGRRHDLVALRVGDPAESALPDAGAPILLADPEELGEIALSSSRANRAAYAAAWAAARTRGQSWVRGAGGDLVDLTTGQPAAAALMRYFAGRR